MSVNLFDANFYRSVNPDLVAAGLKTEAQLLSHFQTYGLNEGREFSPFANLNFYRASNPDLASAGLTTNNQLLQHLQRFGIAEGRQFSEFVDLNFYLAANPDVKQVFGNNKEQVFEHLRALGINEGRQVSDFFDINYYRSHNPDLIKAGLNYRQILEHFETYGLNEGRQFSSTFDLNYYRDVYPDLVTAKLSNRQLYQHFQLFGLDEGRQSSPSFNIGGYIATNTDLKTSGLNKHQLYTHYSLYGQQEGRNTNYVKISNILFSGKEGDIGTFQIQLSQAPTKNVTMSFSVGNFLTIDADRDASNGTQNTLTFTPTDWNQPHTVKFIAEKDGSSSDRLFDNKIGYTLNGGQIGSGAVDLGTVTNTYVPDPNHFQIEIDYRNDYLNFWTSHLREIALLAANDWAKLIATQESGFVLNNVTLQQIEANGQNAFAFTINRYIDGLLIFASAYDHDNAAAWGGFVWGGGINTSPLPRIGEIAINAVDNVTASDRTIYSIVSHEIGHALGLLGLNYTGSQFVTQVGNSSFFTGPYSQAYNGGNQIPMQLQKDGGGHPANSIPSILSYGEDGAYSLSAPSEFDKRFLADSGYLVYGVNA